VGEGLGEISQVFATETPSRGLSASGDRGIEGWPVRPTAFSLFTLAHNTNTIIGMKLTLQIQLLPDTTQASALRTTVERFNEAATWPAGAALAQQCANKIALQKLTYYELRARFGLPADTAIRCIAQVVEAYKRDKTICPTFRPHAAVPFSMGKNIGFKGPDRVSISTLTGRVVVPFIMGAYQAERFGFAHG
jgi:putative transposase